MARETIKLSLPRPLLERLDLLIQCIQLRGGPSVPRAVAIEQLLEAVVTTNLFKMHEELEKLKGNPDAPSELDRILEGLSGSEPEDLN